MNTFLRHNIRSRDTTRQEEQEEQEQEEGGGKEDLFIRISQQLRACQRIPLVNNVKIRDKNETRQNFSKAFLN